MQSQMQTLDSNIKYMFLSVMIVNELLHNVTVHIELISIKVQHKLCKYTGRNHILCAYRRVYIILYGGDTKTCFRALVTG